MLQSMLCSPPSKTSRGEVTVSKDAKEIQLSDDFVPSELTWSESKGAYLGSETVDVIKVDSVVELGLTDRGEDGALFQHGQIIDVVEMTVGGSAIVFTTRYSLKIH